MEIEQIIDDIKNACTLYESIINSGYENIENNLLNIFKELIIKDYN